MALSIGQRVTLLKIDEAFAMSHRYEVEVRSVLDGEAVGYQGRKRRMATVRQRGKRKEFFLDLGNDDILLDGWNLPFQTDTEAGTIMAGNACYNLVGDPEAIRDCIQSLAVVPVTEGARAKIIVSRVPRTCCDDSETQLLYPELEIDHAVVSRMKERVSSS
ncbi:MAG: hypothetical protein ACJ8C4_13400 [Gemmataceae bacterium]